MIRTKRTSDHLSHAYEFRRAMGQPVDGLSREGLLLQTKLIVEEFEELRTSVKTVGCYPDNKRAKEEALKELADLAYVVFQLAAAMGWDLNEALDRVHKSNLSKLVDGKPLRREDGKVLKGPNYKPPTLIDLI